MRNAALTCALLLGAACAPSGGLPTMTPETPADVPSSPRPAAEAATAAEAPVRDLRTATFALG